MKKVYSIAGSILLLLALAFTGNAMATETDNSGQVTEQTVQATGSDGGGQVAVGNEKISGAKDKRLIKPKMNARQRMEMQRALQKRAAANRNALIQQEKEKQSQLGN